MSTNLAVAALAGLLTLGVVYALLPLAIRAATGWFPTRRVAVVAVYLAAVVGLTVYVGLRLAGVSL